MQQTDCLSSGVQSILSVRYSSDALHRCEDVWTGLDRRLDIIQVGQLLNSQSISLLQLQQNMLENYNQ